MTEPQADQQRQRAGGSNPRRTHLVPAAFLKRFTANRDDRDQLTVVDRELGKRWRGVPEKIAVEKDFYRLPDRFGDPVGVELVLQRVEDAARPAFEWIDTHGTFPRDGQLRADLLAYVGSLAVRVAGARADADAFAGVTLKRLVRDLAADPAAFAEARRRILEKDPGAPDMSSDELIETVNAGRVKLGLKDHAHTIMMLALTLDIHPYFAHRRWRLVIANAGEPNFICSNNPVGVSWQGRPHPPVRPRIGLPNTVVTLPVGRRIALEGRVGGDGDDEEEIAYRGKIARLNLATAERASQLYFHGGDAMILTPTGRIVGVDEWIRNPGAPRADGDERRDKSQ